MHKLSRAVTKWTRACDRRLALLNTYTRMITENVAMWVLRLSNVDWVCSKTQILLGTFEDSKATSGGVLCILESRTSVRSAEPEVISLEAGLCMNGIPALDPWDVVIEVLHSFQQKNTHQTLKHTHQALRDQCRKEEVNSQVPRNRARSETHSTNSNVKTKRHGNREVDDLSDVDHVVTSAKPSQFRAQLYIFEDNEVIKGRSPSMRHASRTHRVALDWSFDRINLDRQIPIRWVATKKNNSRTRWRKVVSPVMSGIIFSVCWTSWVFRRCLAANSVQLTTWRTWRRSVVAKSKPIPAAIFFQLQNPKTMSKKSMQER